MPSDVELFLRQCVALNNGIAPFEDDWSSSLDYNRVLASLPKDEATKMKRKFRKLWRKLCPEQATPGKVPGRKERYARKRAVMKFFMETFIQPRLDALTATKTSE